MTLQRKAFNDIITFSRASNATVTGSNGLVQYAPHNLLTYSEQFDVSTAWSVVSGATNWQGTGSAPVITANAGSSPDGAVTADKIVLNLNGGTTSNDRSGFSQAFTATVGTTYTASVYIKPLDATTDAEILASNLCIFAAGASASSQTITDVGNGWKRLVRTYIAATTGGTFRFQLQGGVVGSPSTFNGLIWGAQLSVGPLALAYTPTTTAAVYGPRFDYDPVSLAAKGLLIEEQRTNLLTYSEQFDNAAWTKAAVTVTANAVAAPDGTTTADSITASSANGGAYQGVSVTAGAVYTWSVYAKAGTGASFRIKAQATATVAQFVFNLTAVTATLTAGAGTATITSVGDGWYRCTVTATAALTGTGYHEIDITNSGETLYLWGAQFEAGAFATSYIPTVASQVTRAADVASINTLSPWYNATEGTLYAEADVLSVSSPNPHNIASLYTSSTNLMRFWIWEGAPTVDRFTVINSTQQAEFTSGTLTANTVFKGAAAYKTDNFAGSFNGAAASTDTSGTVPTGFSQLNLGSQTGVTGFMSGHIRRIAYYPRRLTNSELQALTA